MRIKIPLSYTVLIGLILVWAVYTTGVWTGLIDVYSDAALLSAFITGWIGVLVLALLGALLLGMYVGHRILSLADITPFEEEMLRMKEDVREMKHELKRIHREFRELEKELGAQGENPGGPGKDKPA